MRLTKEDLAKYPFCNEALKYVENLGVTLSDLCKPGYRVILNRAVERIRSAINFGRIRTDLTDLDVEILSYPASLALLAVISLPPLYRRYAVAEAKRVEEELRVDEDYKVKYIAESEFGWRVRLVRPGMYEMFFADYLSIAPRFRAPSWKLVNRIMVKGWVQVNKFDLARLISEAVRIKIASRADSPSPVDMVVPDEIARMAGELRGLFESRRKVIELEEEYAGPVVEEAFPPCIKAILSDLLKGSTLPHMARFTLTSFLLNVGKSVDEVVSLFSLTADFDEKITRYQVEHIAGLRGSRIKYTPPSCSTLKTFGLCIEGDPICSRIKHPLTYYKIKMRELSSGRRS